MDVNIKSTVSVESQQWTVDTVRLPLSPVAQREARFRSSSELTVSSGSAECL